MPTWGVSPGPFERHAQSTDGAFAVFWLLFLWSRPAYLLVLTPYTSWEDLKRDSRHIIDKKVVSGGYIHQRRQQI